MAANKFDHSRSLFMKEDGSPLKFHMRPCSERKYIRHLIEHGGGVITSIATEDSIRLAEKGSIVTTENYISSRYITECVKENMLLDKTKFRCLSDTKSQEAAVDDDMEPAPIIIRVSEKSIKGRKKYTTVDDTNIVKYVIENKLHGEIKGNKIWEDMEFIGITSHSSQSMRDHMLKVILPNISLYNFPHHWKSLLTGDITSVLHEPQDEETNTDSDNLTIDTDSDGPMVNSGASQSKIKEGNENKCRSETISPVVIPENVPFQESVNSNKTSPKKPLLTESHYSGNKLPGKSFLKKDGGLISKSPKKQLLTKGIGSPRKSPRKHILTSASSEKAIDQTEEDLEEDSVSMSDSCKTSDHDDPKKIIMVSLDSTDDDVHHEKTLSNQSFSGCPENSDRSNRLKHDHGKDGRIGNDGPSESSDHDGPSESSDHDDVDEFDRELFKLTQSQKQTTEKLDDSLQTSEDSLLMFDDSLQMSDENGSQGKSRTRQRQAKFGQNVSNNETSSPLRKKQKINSELRSSGSEGPNPTGSRSIQSQRAKNIVQVRKKKECFDRQLGGKETQQMEYDSSDEDSLDAECERQASEEPVMRHTDDTEMTTKRSKRIMKSPHDKTLPKVWKGKSAKPVETQYSSDEDQLENDCKAIQALAERFGLSLDEAMYCTYVNSGSIADTVHWIRMGVDRAGYPAWTAEDDEVLQGDDESERDRLAKIFGTDRFQARIAFLKKQKL